nr:Gfo/Idh/MocA family oxidoreductase [uncultured Pedobacter sp.]
MKKELNYKTLIIGYGYSGKRFLQTLNHLTNEENISFEIAIVDNNPSAFFNLDNNYGQYNEIQQALEDFIPEIVIVAVNEKFHFSILKNLANSSTKLVLCEKPLVETIEQLEYLQTINFKPLLSLNLVERFSPILTEFFKWKNSLTDPITKKVEFFWGKNRVKDHRPTIGVISEIIHPLDLIQYMFGLKEIKFQNAISISSDFSVSGEDVTDSLNVIGKSNDCIISGHSSFVWVHRHREIIAFIRDLEDTYRINLHFDNPRWDCDQLIIDKITSAGKITNILTHETTNEDFPKGLFQTYKVSKFVKHSILQSEGIVSDGPTLLNFNGAIEIQKVLYAIQELCDMEKCSSLRMFS